MQTAVSRPSLCALGSLFIRTQVCTPSGQTTASAVACDLLKCQVNIVGLCSRLCLGDEAGGWPPSVRSVWNSVRQSRLFLLSGLGHPNCGTVTKRTLLGGAKFSLRKTRVCVCTTPWTVAVCHCPVTSFFALVPRIVSRKYVSCMAVCVVLTLLVLAIFWQLRLLFSVPGHKAHTNLVRNKSGWYFM